MILMNPGDELGPSVNTHTCILQLLMVVGVEDKLGPFLSFAVMGI